MPEVTVLLPLAVEGVEDVVLDGPVGPDQGQALGRSNLSLRDAGCEVAVLPGVLNEGIRFHLTGCIIHVKLKSRCVVILTTVRLRPPRQSAYADDWLGWRETTIVKKGPNAMKGRFSSIGRYVCSILLLSGFCLFLGCQDTRTPEEKRLDALREERSRCMERCDQQVDQMKQECDKQFGNFADCNSASLGAYGLCSMDCPKVE